MHIEFWHILRIVPAAVIGLTIHEYAHAVTATTLGDNTARKDGRLTLNPLKHIDWLGFMFILFAGFGWAKPVQFNPSNLRHPHRDEILISLAGPLSNLVLAIICFLGSHWLKALSAIPTYIESIVLWGGIVNIGLFVFNLLPLPPLDGSHLYLTFLKDSHPKLMQTLYRWGTAALFLLIIIENHSGIDILHFSAIMDWVIEIIYKTLNLI